MSNFSLANPERRVLCSLQICHKIQVESFIKMIPPRHFWSRFRLRVRLVHARAHPVIFNSTANPAGQAVVGALSTGSRTYLIAPGQGIQVNAPNGGQIGFDVLIAPAA